MPSQSQAQFKAMQVAKYEPNKLYSRNKGLAKMSDKQLNEFTANSPKGLPKYKVNYKGDRQ